MKNIYKYLDEIKFEKRINDRCELIKKAGIDHILVSEFALKQFCFSLLQDMFEKIYDDVEYGEGEETPAVKTEEQKAFDKVFFSTQYDDVLKKFYGDENEGK